MREATLQLKMRMQNANVINNVEVRRIILHTILSLFAALAFWYLLILGNMVVNIVQRRALEKEALTLSNDVGALELSYLSVSNSIDIPLSVSMGFKEIHPDFATRKSLGYVKPNSNEI